MPRWPCDWIFESKRSKNMHRDYALLTDKLLGQGSYGKVFMAQRRRDAELCACKVGTSAAPPAAAFCCAPCRAHCCTRCCALLRLWALLVMRVMRLQRCLLLPAAWAPAAVMAPWQQAQALPLPHALETATIHALRRPYRWPLPITLHIKP